jgi:hypothetical protein
MGNDIHYSLACIIGRSLAKVRLNRVRLKMENGLELCFKRRRWYARPLIWGGNLYLRWLDSSVRVLPDAAWQMRECNVYTQLYGIDVRLGAHGELIAPAGKGICLDRLLKRNHDAVSQQALAAAARALKRLHSIQLASGNSSRIPLSHGDATIFNVLYDIPTDTAHWFDFETEHDPARSWLWRRADDLRALLTSACSVVEEDAIARTAAALLEAYGDAQISSGVARHLAAGALRPSAYYLAQAWLTPRRNRMLEAAVAAVLASAPGCSP